MSSPALRLSEIRWGRLLLAALGIEALLLLGHFLYMVVYSYALQPGQDLAHYQEHAQRSGPYFVILAGVPVGFALTRAFLRKLSSQAALATGAGILLALLIIDLGLHAILSLPIPPIAPVAWAAKWMGIILATRSVMRRDASA
ncbi:MAG TPA: hypothetical protein VLU25_20455 [Acidobacteriota bacterium]|nr:hypothetical protein [Acidobacteriota bacterium]